MSSNRQKLLEYHVTTPEVSQASRSEAVREKLSRNKGIKSDEIGLKVFYQPTDGEDIEIE